MSDARSKRLKLKKDKWQLERERKDAERKKILAALDKLINDAHLLCDELRKSDCFAGSKERKMQHAEQGMFSLRRARIAN